MDFYFRRAAEKLQKEQKEGKEKARLKLERERTAKSDAEQRRDAIDVAKRSRRLERQLKEEEDEETQENLRAGKGIMFFRLLEAVAFDGHGDKIKLPPSCFTDLSDQGAFDEGPIYFRLSAANQLRTSHSTGKNSTHSGVLEFTATEGTVGLPPHVWNNLFGEDTQEEEIRLLEVRRVWLPKGNYARLQPHVSGFSDIHNHKAVLETSLRHHATLSEGEVIAVNYGVLTYKLTVLELKPSSSVSILDTDMEVDLISADSAGKSTNDHRPTLLTIGVQEPGIVEEGKYKYYRFYIDNDISERIARGDCRVEIKINMDDDDDEGDADLYVSKHPLVLPTQHHHQWSCHDIGSKVLVFGPEEKNFGSGMYIIALYGFRGRSKYKATVSVQDNSVGKQLGSSSSSSSLSPLSSSLATDTVACKNCRFLIPNRNITLHEAYCSRHNVLCQHAGCGIVLRHEDVANHLHCHECGQAFHKEEMEKHMKVFHEPLQCPCGVVLNKEQMVEHGSSDCPLRLILCRFCGDMVQAGSTTLNLRDRFRGLSEHESVCGSRTTPCTSCGRSVMLKEMEIHHTAVHQNG